MDGDYLVKLVPELYSRICFESDPKLFRGLSRSHRILSEKDYYDTYGRLPVTEAECRILWETRDVIHMFESSTYIYNDPVNYTYNHLIVVRIDRNFHTDYRSTVDIYPDDNELSITGESHNYGYSYRSFVKYIDDLFVGSLIHILSRRVGLAEINPRYVNEHALQYFDKKLQELEMVGKIATLLYVSGTMRSLNMEDLIIEDILAVNRVMIPTHHRINENSKLDEALFNLDKNWGQVEDCIDKIRKILS